MTREEMIDEATKIAVASWRGGRAPWSRVRWFGIEILNPHPVLTRAIRSNFTRIASREAKT